MENSACSFTGHREIFKDDISLIESNTKAEITGLIKSGVKFFISGGAIGYDILCGNIVIELKKIYPDIKLYLALPCKEQDKYWSDEQKKNYDKLLKSADKLIYVSDSYFRGCMHKRNRYMVDNSEYIISYCTKQTGGTYYTTKYAEKQGKKIINIL